MSNTNETFAGRSKADGLVMLYQPIKSAAGGFSCVEALVRIPDASGNLVGPGNFAGALDSEAHARALGRTIMETTFAQAAAWHRDGLDVKVCMNASPRYLNDDRFIEDLDAALLRHPDIVPDLIELEITETAALPNIERLEQRLQACIRRGLRIAIDDFGAGNASLSYLQQLSAHTVKIDRKFVSRMIDYPQDMAIIAGIITAGRMLGIDLVAEGVETAGQASLLTSMGASHLQGYLFSHPIPGDQIASWIREANHPRRGPCLSSTINLIPTVLAGHVHRTNRFLSEFRAEDYLPDHFLDIAEVDNCHLGRWLRSDGTRHFACEPIFHDVLVMHEALHRLAKEAKLAMIGGRVAKARANIRLFEETNTAMVSRIEQLSAKHPC